MKTTIEAVYRLGQHGWDFRHTATGWEVFVRWFEGMDAEVLGRGDNLVDAVKAAEARTCNQKHVL